MRADFKSLQGCLIAALLSISATASAATAPDSCAAIVSEAARLSCFDSFFPQTFPETGPAGLDSGSSAVTGDGAEADLTAGDSDGGPLEILNTAALEALPPVEAREVQELALTEQEFGITAHHPNYILPLTYNFSPDYSAFGPFEELFSDSEIKMQLSLKTRILPNLWGDSSLWVAYTQQSYWQLYADSDASAPFRETNHQPEVFWQLPVDFELLGWKASLATLAFNHQSNGRSDPLSRSWNRITGELLFEREGFVASAKTWHRIDEDPENDNNPNIEDFMGRMQLGLAYKRNDHTFAIDLRNNLRSKNRSGVELSWSFPLVEHLKGYVQIYSGYGENLIDMENYTNRIGIGVALTDWL